MTQMMVKPDPFPPLRMAWEDFVEWAIKNEISAEWVDGEVEYKHVYTDPITGEKYQMVTIEHDELRAFIVLLLTLFNDFHRLGRLFGEECGLKLRPGTSGREPDATFVRTGNPLVQIGRLYVEGPADMVLEVVSRESVRRDRVTKKAEYEQGGIKEYWLADPLKQRSSFYRLDANGKYQEVALDAEGKFYSSALPGFWLKPEWFWQNPRLRTPDILREWGLM